MYVRFEHVSNRLSVQLLHDRREGKKVHAERYGGLGTVPLQNASAAERLGFWATFDSRWQVICARHAHLTDADRDRVRRRIAKRIPEPSTEAELRLIVMAQAWVNAVAAIEALDAGEDGMREAAKQLQRLARQTRRIKTDNGTEKA